MATTGFYVIDGSDITRYAGPVEAAASIEGYDAQSYAYFSSDGTVFEATVKGQEWGPVALHPTSQIDLDGLVQRLKSLAGAEGLTTATLADDPDSIYLALMEAYSRRRQVRKWWRRRT